MTKNVEDNNIKSQYISKPPDGGYGYVICVVFCINCIVCYCFIGSFGVIYNDFFLSLGEGTTGISLVQSVSAIVLSLSGIFTNVTLKRFTLRQVGLFGAILYTLGWFLNYFVTTLYQIVFTCGVLQGMGQGVLTTVSFTVFNLYFDRNRFVVLSLCQVVIGIGSMTVPMLVGLSLQEFGFRGTLLLISAFSAHTCVVAILVHPVEWHSKRILVQNEDARENKTNERMNVKKNDETEMELLPKRSSVDIKNEENLNLDSTRRISLWKKTVDFLDLSLLSDIVFVNIIMGIAVGLFTDYAFFLVYPLYLFTLDFSPLQVSRCVSILAAGELVSKGVLALAGKFFPVKSRTVFFHTIIFTILARLLFLQVSSVSGIVVTSALMGFLRGSLMTPLALIYAEYIPEKFTAAMGLSMLTMGLTNTALLPVAGYIRDYYDSYTVLFYALTAVNLICVVTWGMEFALKKSDEIGKTARDDVPKILNPVSL